jgi:DnaJ-class molecular chaperone
MTRVSLSQAQRAYDDRMPEELVSVRCPICDGDGIVNVLETSNDICPHCDGHGEIDLTQSELKKMRMENE